MMPSKQPTRRSKKNYSAKLPAARSAPLPRGTQDRRLPENYAAARSRLYPLMALAAFIGGLLLSYVAWGRTPPEPAHADAAPVVDSSADAGMDLVALREKINPPDGYRLGVRYGALGPRLLEAGVIDYEAFAGLYEQAGSPLTANQVKVLKRGRDGENGITAGKA